MLDQLGKIYDFKNEYDSVLDERFWVIELPGLGQFNGETVDEVVESLKAIDVKVTRW